MLKKFQRFRSNNKQNENDKVWVKCDLLFLFFFIRFSSYSDCSIFFFLFFSFTLSGMRCETIVVRTSIETRKPICAFCSSIFIWFRHMRIAFVWNLSRETNNKKKTNFVNENIKREILATRVRTMYTSVNICFVYSVNDANEFFISLFSS